MKLIRNNKLFEDIFNDIEVDETDIEKMSGSELVTDSESLDCMGSTFVVQMILDDSVNIDMIDRTSKDKNTIKILNLIEKRIRMSFDITGIDITMKYYIPDARYYYSNIKESVFQPVECYGRQMIRNIKVSVSGFSIFNLVINTSITDNLGILKAMDAITKAVLPICNIDYHSNVGIHQTVTFYKDAKTIDYLYYDYDKYDCSYFGMKDIAESVYSKKKMQNMFYAMRRIDKQFDYSDILRLYQYKCGYNEGDRYARQVYQDGFDYSLICTGQRLTADNLDIFEIILERQVFNRRKEWWYKGKNYPTWFKADEIPQNILDIVWNTPYRVYFGKSRTSMTILIVFDGVSSRDDNYYFYGTQSSCLLKDGKCKLSECTEEKIFDLMHNDIYNNHNCFSKYRIPALLITLMGVEKAREFMKNNKIVTLR